MSGDDRIANPLAKAIQGLSGREWKFAWRLPQAGIDWQRVDMGEPPRAGYAPESFRGRRRSRCARSSTMPPIALARHCGAPPGTCPAKPQKQLGGHLHRIELGGALFFGIVGGAASDLPPHPSTPALFRCFPPANLRAGGNFGGLGLLFLCLGRSVRGSDRRLV